MFTIEFKLINLLINNKYTIIIYGRLIRKKLKTGGESKGGVGRSCWLRRRLISIIKCLRKTGRCYEIRW